MYGIRINVLPLKTRWWYILLVVVVVLCVFLESTIILQLNDLKNALVFQPGHLKI